MSANADDELENIDLTAQEKTDKNIELKKKKPLYDVYNEDDNSLLSKYDEEAEKEVFVSPFSLYCAVLNESIAWL